MTDYPQTFKSLVLGITVALAFLTGWEVFWRMRNYPIAPDDDKALWAHQRARIEHLDSTDVVVIGSSRVLFDIQLDPWEEVTGTRPVMLAAAGTTPVPVFQDIVENSSFNGILIVGVTPPLYFSPLIPSNDSYAQIAGWIEHYHDRTYADRLNHRLSRIPQSYLAYLNSGDGLQYNRLNLRTLINRIPAPERVPTHPPFPFFSYQDFDRNTTMLDIVTADTSYARKITNFWSFVLQPPPDSPSPEEMEMMKNKMIELNVELVQRFEARGGRVIFVRSPSQNKFRMVEDKAFSRAAYWELLLEKTGCTGYHFEDYSFLNQYTLPEWSHLATEDAKQFTRDLANLMHQDGVLR